VYAIWACLAQTACVSTSVHHLNLFRQDRDAIDGSVCFTPTHPPVLILTTSRWWDRCQCLFANYDVITQHIQNSLDHNRCPVCDFDSTSWEGLLDHCCEDGCRTMCQGCKNRRGAHWRWDSRVYWQHLITDDVCDECERHFSALSDLHWVFHAFPQHKYEQLMLHSTKSRITRHKMSVIVAIASTGPMAR
jgi:hypothetical protein